MDDLRKSVATATEKLAPRPAYDPRVLSLASRFNLKERYAEFLIEWKFYSGEEAEKFWNFVMDFALFTCLHTCNDGMRVLLRTATKKYNEDLENQSKSWFAPQKDLVKPVAQLYIDDAIQGLETSNTFQKMQNNLKEIRALLSDKQSLSATDYTTFLQGANLILPRPVELPDVKPDLQNFLDKKTLRKRFEEFLRGDIAVVPSLYELWQGQPPKKIAQISRWYFFLLRTIEPPRRLSIEFILNSVDLDGILHDVDLNPPVLQQAVKRLDPDNWGKDNRSLLTLESNGTAEYSILLTVSNNSTAVVLLDSTDSKLKLQLTVLAALLIFASGFENCNSLQQLVDAPQQKTPFETPAQWVERLLKQ